MTEQNLISFNLDQSGGEPRIGSDQIAAAFGIGHRDLLNNMVRKYVADFERISPLRFENANTINAVAMLTEDQAYLLLTYLKNTERARVAKLALVMAFRRAREFGGEGKPLRMIGQALVGIADRLDAAEKRADQQAAAISQHELRLRQLEAKRRASKALVASPQQVLDIFESCARTINGVLDAEHERRKSPSKHVRSAHWRALADGRRVSVRESVVGDGESIH